MAKLLPFLMKRRMADDGHGGFTLIELTLVTVIMGTLAALAVPNLQAVVERARMAKTIGDISSMGQSLTEYAFTHGDTYPTSLAGIGMDGLLDSWGTPYQYLVVAGAQGKGGFRKDKFLVPINSDYDLYSMGPDRESVAPLNSPVSHDDIIRANDGGFVGIAEDF